MTLVGALFKAAVRIFWLACAFCLAACGGGSSGGSAAGAGGTLQTLALPNVLAVVVDAGPTGATGNVNRLYAEVTVCQPGNTSLCQTIDHVVVDTGSTGLRLLSSVLQPGLALPRVKAASGQPLLDCARFVDGTFAWGPVSVADVKLGGETATATPIQVIADPTFNALSSACSSGTAVSSVASLGGNGILGVGLFKQDCGTACATVPNNKAYFTCANAACLSAVGTVVPVSQQIQNPVALFPVDNNGILIDLPAVSGNAMASLAGSLIFGIGTQTNNQFTSGKVLLANALGYVTTQFSGRTLRTSYLDTGSNGLFFDSATLPLCSPGNLTGFYCPSATTPLSASLIGSDATNVSVSFQVDNALTLFSAGGMAVLPTLAGDIGSAQTFDWGLPFFYGRKVFFGIEGKTVANMGTGPFYAF